MVCRVLTQGLRPEVVPSQFQEDLPKSEFIGEGVHEYPVQTASHKALEVYERLVKESPENPPDLVIAADTIIVYGEEILEKPADKVDNLRMLADMSGHSVSRAADAVHGDDRRRDCAPDPA